MTRSRKLTSPSEFIPNASSSKHAKTTYDGAAADSRTGPYNRVPNDCFLAHLGPFEEDAPLHYCSLPDNATFAQRGAPTDGGASFDSASLCYGDRRQQDNVFGEVGGLLDARVPEFGVAPDRTGEDIVRGRQIAARGPDI